MPCLDFARAILKLEHIRGGLDCHAHYLRYNRNLPAAIRPYRKALIAEISERVAFMENGNKSRTIVNGFPSSRNPASSEFPCVAA